MAVVRIKFEGQKKNLFLSKFVTFYSTLSEENQQEIVDNLLYTSSPSLLLHIRNVVCSILKKDILTLIPDLVKQKILSYLDGKTLLICTLVCKNWKRILSSQEKLWEIHCIKSNAVHQNVNSSWENLFQNMYFTQLAIKHGNAFQILTEDQYPEKLHDVVAIDYHESYLALAKESKENTSVQVLKWYNNSFSIISCIYLNTFSTRISCIKLFRNRWFVIGHFSGFISFWNLKKNEESISFPGHSSPVFSVDFLPELNLAVSGSADRTVRLWEFHSGAALWTFPNQEHWAVKVILKSNRQLLANSLLNNKNVLLIQTRYNIHCWVWNTTHDNVMGNLLSMMCILSIPIHAQTELFSAGCIFDGTMLSFVKQGIQGNGELNQVFVPSGSLIAKYKLKTKTKKLLAVGKYFAIILTTSNERSENAIFILNLDQKLKQAYCWLQIPLPHTRMKTPDGSQITICEEEWLNGLGESTTKGLILAVSVTSPPPNYSEVICLKWIDKPSAFGKKIFMQLSDEEMKKTS